MNTPTIGTQIKVRLFSYKSSRHYGGREITATPHICDSVLVGKQTGGQPYIVELMQPCIAFNKGHKIAVTEKDFNL